MNILHLLIDELASDVAPCGKEGRLLLAEVAKKKINSASLFHQEKKVIMRF